MSATAAFDDDDNLDWDAALTNFDVDKAVQEHEKQKYTNTTSPHNNNKSTTTTANDMEEQQEAKKRKISLSPGSTTPDDSSSALTEPVQALRKTLSKVFGYSDFRKGQVQVIQALLQKRDVSVYWATGQGKSLCYQIPALHLQQVAFVVSPLISLMQDQCHKLNALSDKPLATYLGSAQMDRRQEELAWQGAYCLVYLTPEKLTTCLDRMVNLHCNYKPIALVAIDEAHTVSEWGTDFRPDFRELSCLRQHAVLRDIPILTLTATAVPRVQNDIAQVLQLRSSSLLVSRQSLDRKNLRLAIYPRTGNAVATLQGHVQTWQAATSVRDAQRQSTIIYVATRKEVESVATTLQAQLQNSSVVTVLPYHAGMTAAARQAAHTAFLTGKCTVLVATVAFGMGIDKPDTRRIIHFGPPKNMEEYYQQIGRAGRDGAAAEAVLYANGQDFDKYVRPTRSLRE